MFYALPALTAGSIFEIEKPWEYENKLWDTVKSKEEWVALASNPTTKHCFYSLNEGIEPIQRIAEVNPVLKIHGVVADFDSEISDETIETMKRRVKTEFYPNWIHRTYSKGVRLIWLFEQPVSVTPAIGKLFLSKVSKLLRPGNIFMGYDPASCRASQYFDVGKGWKQLNTAPIPFSMVCLWAYELDDKTLWTGGESNIPMPEVATEVAKKYPGRWQGPFEEGSRGIAFWYPTATNPTGAIVRRNGMQCFVGSIPFAPWSMLLGREFTQKYEAERIGATIAGIYYDGTKYWFKENGLWQDWTKPDIQLHLKVKHQISPRTAPKEINSELDKIVSTIHSQNRVKRTYPLIHFPEGVLVMDGERMLNTSNMRCMEPCVETNVSWGNDFPWVARFLDNFFDPPEQLPFFLSWLKWFYENGYNQTPKKGHAVFIAGEVGQGKTFLSTFLVANLVGGHRDASDYLLGDQTFSGAYLNAPLMTIDDNAPASDHKKKMAYSTMVKKLVANHNFMYNEKFEKAGPIKWFGRLIVTCNLDPVSIKLFPDMEVSIQDKLCLFKAKTYPCNFPRDLEVRVRKELPYLCRWLLEYIVPEQCTSGEDPGSLVPRFGVKNYMEKSLLDDALKSGSSYSFLEVLDMFTRLYTQENPGKHSWTGTATNLLSAMLAFRDHLYPVVKDMTVDFVGIRLSQLKSMGFPLEIGREGRLRIWTFIWNPDGSFISSSATSASDFAPVVLGTRVKTVIRPLPPTMPDP